METGAVSANTKNKSGNFWTRRNRLRVQNHFVTYLILAPGALLFLYPLLWMLSTSLKPKHQIFTYPIEWILDTWMWSNYGEVFEQVPFLQYTINTAFITVVGVVGTLIGSSLAAYGFARFRFPGKDVLFALMLSTMMVPIWVTLIPSFLMFRGFGWLNTYLPILVPAFFAQPFYTFLLRQFFMTVPQDLEDAARIDGANRLQIFLNIMLPLSRPALATVGIFAFFFYWNEFLLPLIYLQDQSKFPISVGISAFVTEYSSDFGLMMAASGMALMPPMVIFFVAQRYFIQGFVLSGVKG